MKLLLIGGHPKGYAIPFHPNTRSGKVLRGIIDEHKIEAEIIDLWEDDEGQSKALISQGMLDIIGKYQGGSCVVALGRWVEKALIKHGVECVYLPHPASWQPGDREKLTEGIIRLNRD